MGRVAFPFREHRGRKKLGQGTETEMAESAANQQSADSISASTPGDENRLQGHEKIGRVI